ncbi:MAG TPA: response regulator [Terriglobia bacterium]|nr:response regulator [Terriglobia bacterium]
MPRILMGGFDVDLKDSLKQRLNGYPITRISNAQEVLEELAGGSVSLLIFDQELEGALGFPAVEKLRNDPRWVELPVIYYARQGAVDEIVSKLGDMRYCKTLLPPLDPDEVARQAAQALGIILAPSEDALKVEQAVAQARARFLEVIAARLETIDRAGMSLLEGHLTPDLREAARREAHKLAGLLGTIGFPTGSRFARELEEILGSGGQSSPAQAIRYSELAVALRLDIEKPASGLPPVSSPCGERPASILIVDSDDDLSERLEAEALAHGVRVQRTNDLARASQMICEDAPDVVLADLLLSGKEEEGLDFIESLAIRTPPVPVIVLTSKEALTDRVEVARRGGHGFLARSSSASKILEAALKLVDRLHSGDAKVMAVDDDPQILSLLFSLLKSRGVSIKTLDDPTQFWKCLETFAPDLLVLDIDMPKLGGLELCRVVRNDPRWAETPIVFLTAHNDPATIQRVFSAGADDFVSKPIVGPELMTRIFNRLERSRMLRRMLETDFLTGAFNRRKSTQMIADFIDLSRKHEQPFSLAVIEMENLEQINAEHGHAAGDLALDRAARLLQNAFRSEDVFARWSGGEFVVGMYGLTRYDGVQRLTGLLERINKEAFESPEGGKFSVALNAGLAQFPDDGINLKELYKAAVLARAGAGPTEVCKAAAARSSTGQQDASQNADVALVMRDEAQASLLMHTLEARGYRTRWIQNGRSAEKLLAGSQPLIHSRVILMEVDLPNLDGISLLKQLGSDGVLQKTRVIMLTTPSVANEAQAVLKLGAFDSVAKPLNPPVIAQHVRRALDAA